LYITLPQKLFIYGIREANKLSTFLVYSRRESLGQCFIFFNGFYWSSPFLVFVFWQNLFLNLETLISIKEPNTDRYTHPALEVAEIYSISLEFELRWNVFDLLKIKGLNMTILVVLGLILKLFLRLSKLWSNGLDKD